MVLRAKKKQKYWTETKFLTKSFKILKKFSKIELSRTNQQEDRIREDMLLKILRDKKILIKKKGKAERKETQRNYDKR